MALIEELMVCDFYRPVALVVVPRQLVLSTVTNKDTVICVIIQFYCSFTRAARCVKGAKHP